MLHCYMTFLMCFMQINATVVDQDLQENEKGQGQGTGNSFISN